jgi:hypothetical protein
MMNVKTEVKGKNLVITVDMTKDFGRSGSGKTVVIASTKGFKNVAANGHSAMINLNVNRYPKDGE